MLPCSPADDEIARIGIDYALSIDTAGGRLDDFHTENSREADRDLVPAFRKVGVIRLKLVCPKVRAAFRIDQLRVDSHKFTGSPHAPFKDIAHAQFTADLLHVSWFVLYVKAVLHAMTKLPSTRERSVVRSSVMPFARYSCFGSSLRLTKGRRQSTEAGERHSRQPQ
jgi:hypothetical protein